jgi:uncharacterized protein YndB with AHSA1/START domain
MEVAAESNMTVQVKRHLPADAERIFNAWLDQETAGKWLFATDYGKMVMVKIDPQIGGKFLFVDRRKAEDIEHVGEYLEIEKPRRLVFNFSVPKLSKDLSKVIVEIADAPEGGCELTLTHEGVKPDYVAATETGWSDILKALSLMLI